jgi:hypothetical protein
MRTLLSAAVAGLFAAMFTAIFDGHLAAQHAPPPIEVVDLQQLLAEQVTEVSRQKLGIDQQRDAATAFATALTNALDATAQADRAVLLVKPAVLNGAIDVTDSVRLRLHLALTTHPSSTPPASTP